MSSSSPEPPGAEGALDDHALGVPLASHSTVGGGRFPAIADYGFISDCEVTALIAPSGSVEWMCLPRMDGPSVFAAILDRHAGWFRLGLSGEEGTFTICSVWLVSALTEIGEIARARALCAKLLSYASPLQLYAEEIEPHSGLHLGNFPQGFTHLALINAVVRPERERTGKGKMGCFANPTPSLEG